MDYKYIEQLLDRYWQCLTSLEEEQILRSFFSQGDVPEHLRKYCQLFTNNLSADDEKLSEGFEQRVLSAIEKENGKRNVVISWKHRFQNFCKAAAVVAVVLTIAGITERTYQLNREEGESKMTDSYIKAGDISAAIKIIDKEKSESIARADSLSSVNRPEMMEEMTE